MREEIRRIQKETGVTTVFVTHDQEEALSISDEVMVLNKGIIQQSSNPQQLYDYPENLFVAQFLGSPELSIFEFEDVKEKFQTHTVKQLESYDVKLVGVRPESWIHTEIGTGMITGEVQRLEIVGKERTVRLELENGQIVDITDVDIKFSEGDKVSFTAEAGDMHFFDGDGNRVVIEDAK